MGAPEANAMTDDRHALFSERYASGDIPWDSGITPPEIFDVLAEAPPGRALDLGCGTGTVLRDLLLQGWRADGIDFVPRAVELAGAKLAEFPPAAYQLFCADVTRLGELTALRSGYDLIIDIGCGHATDKARNDDYARGIIKRLKPGGVFMLYASQPRPDSSVGWTSKQVERLFAPALELRWEQRGENATTGGSPASWYRWRKKADECGVEC